MTCHHQNAIHRKKEENKSCRIPFDLQTQFNSYQLHNSPKEAMNPSWKSSNIPWSLKLEGFTVLIFRTEIDDEVHLSINLC